MPQVEIDIGSGRKWSGAVSEAGIVHRPVAASFSRPADTSAYTAPTASVAGDAIAQSTTAGSCSALEFVAPPIDAADSLTEGFVCYVEHETTGTAAKTIGVHLYLATAPVLSAGDNAAIAISNHDADKYLGRVDVALTPNPNGGAHGYRDDIWLPYSLSTAGSANRIYAIHEALTAYTPTTAGAHKTKIGLSRTR